MSAVSLSALTGAASLFALTGAALIGIGLYGAIVHAEPLRRLLAFNLVGGGAFLLFGAVARRGAAAGFGGDPVPQALVITALVVAFAATALAVALCVRLAELRSGAELRADADAGPDADARPAADEATGDAAGAGDG